jgi:hypothetical protein
VPGCVIIGEPLIFGTLGREPALGLPGLTAPGMPGCAREPVVPDEPGDDGEMPGAEEPPGWVGAVPIPLGELPTWALADVAMITANPAASSVFAMGAMGSYPFQYVWSLANVCGARLFRRCLPRAAAMSICAVVCAKRRSQVSGDHGGDLEHAGRGRFRDRLCL